MYVTFKDDIGSTPARVNRYSGEVQINKNIWPYIPGSFKKYILLHEKGHFMQGTRNEIEADEYAFNNYALTEPYSLKNSILSLTKMLPFNKNGHYIRLYEQYKRVLRKDARNGNIKAFVKLKELENMESIADRKYPESLNFMFSDFSLGNLFKSKEIKGLGNDLLAAGLKNIAQNITRQPEQAQQQPQQVIKPPDPAENPDKKTHTIILIVAAVVVIGLIILIIVKSSKK